MSRYKCVVFDFGGVIGHPQAAVFFEEAAAVAGLPRSGGAATLREAYRHFREDYDRGTLDGVRYWTAVLGRAEAGGALDGVPAAGTRDASGAAGARGGTRDGVPRGGVRDGTGDGTGGGDGVPRGGVRDGTGDGVSCIDELIRLDTLSWTALNDEVVRLMHSLRDRGWAVGLLSNMPPELARAIRKDHPGILGLFDAVTFSCDLGSIKPEPAIYHNALASLGLPPEACLFVDDTAANVQGARAVGMGAVLFRGATDVETALNGH